ncbi:MAG: GNAT family N-acetyltransferase [Thermoplasmatales archaeon]|nr:GNAT family N-acetyltransferase [Thermoplasmatales archaeon]
MTISMPQCHGGAGQRNIRASIGSMSTSAIFYFSIVGREHPRFAHNYSEILLSMTNIFQMRTDAEINFRKYVKESIESEDGLVLIAKEQNRIIAYMLCKIVSNPPVLEERKFGAISDAFILEEKRNKRVIKKMENKAVEWFNPTLRDNHIPRRGNVLPIFLK